MTEKKPWQSKTLWINLAVAVSALFVPGGTDWISAHPVEITVGFSVLNIVLRLVTKDKISIE